LFQPRPEFVHEAIDRVNAHADAQVAFEVPHRLELAARVYKPAKHQVSKEIVAFFFGETHLLIYPAQHQFCPNYAQVLVPDTVYKVVHHIVVMFIEKALHALQTGNLCTCKK